MSKDLQSIVKMFLIAVTFSLIHFGFVLNLEAARIQDDSDDSILVVEADESVPVVETAIEQPAEDDEVPDSSAASSTTSGAIQILTKDSFRKWINPLIYLFLIVSFLCWLLALMTPRADGKVPKNGSQNSTSSHGRNIGRAFDAKPDHVDDLTKVGGIDSHDARRLNEAGIWQYEQLRNMTAQQRANLQRKLNLPHIRWYSLAGLSDVSTASVAADSKNSLTANRETEDTVEIRFDSEASSKDTVRSPKFHDQAGVIAGESIASAAITSQEGQGGSNGNSIQHSATTSPPDGKLIADDEAIANGKAIADRKAISNGKTTNESNTESGNKAEEKPATRKSAATETDSLQLSASDHDDLTQLAGVDAEAEQRLNAAGIYRFDQLKELDDQQASQLVEKCRLPNADISDWRRCIYAWGRGIDTTSETDETFASGSIHGIELPQIVDGVFDGEKLVAYPEQVIFRGSNPEGWGRAVGNSIDGVETSISCDSIRSDINYLRLRRTDTRESVVVPMTKGQLFANGDPNENGWNGSSEVFFGGRHIGVFAQQLPQEVETKFSQGGWGFGHRYDHNDRQEWGWAGRVIEPTSFEVSVGCIGETPGTVVFRSSDPSIWNTKSRDGDFRFANPVDAVKHPVNFVRIMREATGEAVIVRVDGNHVLDEGFDPRCGWNGSCSEFSGGLHLGVYHCNLAQDFETRFEFGGWGFGHPYNDNDRQAWGWAGRQLPETVFEISLLEVVPDFMKHELVE